jgi:hypothetical protein
MLRGNFNPQTIWRASLFKVEFYYFEFCWKAGTIRQIFYGAERSGAERWSGSRKNKFSRAERWSGDLEKFWSGAERLKI